jgi:hypothetical protein
MDINIMDAIEIILFVIVFVLASLYFWTKRRKGREKNIEQSVKFEELEAGNYLFMTTPVQEKNCSLTGNCCQYYALLERNGKVIPVEIGVSAKIDIQEAMRVKFISQIGEGEEFKINKDHGITKIET